MSERCRACKAPIVWARTEHGRPMPLDPDPVPNGNVALVGAQTFEGGDSDEVPVAVVLTRVMLERLTGKPPLYLSHFATCPFADKFRRRR